MTWEELFRRAAGYELSEDEVLAALHAARESTSASADEADAETDADTDGGDVN